MAARPLSSGTCPASSTVTEASDTFDPSAAAAGDELRPVTALFADIVGSTGLGERLSPDEVKALIGECVTRMSRTVEEFGGTIQAYMGDGICAYFGVPVAHEDDPERAARAGLRILEVAREYARDVEGAWGIKEFDVRVGLGEGEPEVAVRMRLRAKLGALFGPHMPDVLPGLARLLSVKMDREPDE